MNSLPFEPGGYRFVKGVFQYSAGIAPLAGHRLVRVMFWTPVPLQQGFERIEAIIKAAGRPLTSFAACELRSPAPFTEQGFRAFNEIYVGTLARWGVFDGKTNPVARSNVCPEIDPPAVEVTSEIEAARFRLLLTEASDPMSALCPWAMAQTEALSLALATARPVEISFWMPVRVLLVLLRFSSAVRAAELVFTLSDMVQGPRTSADRAILPRPPQARSQFVCVWLTRPQRRKPPSRGDVGRKVRRGTIAPSIWPRS